MNTGVGDPARARGVLAGLRRAPVAAGYHWLVRCALRPRARGADRLLDVGCGEKPYAPCFRRVRRYVGLDRPAGQNPAWPPPGYADVHGDAARLPFRDGTFDLVLMTSVLHYQAQPQTVFNELARVLAPGGRLLVCEPHITRCHGPGDYFRFTRHGLAHLARSAGLRVEEIAPIGGFWLQQHQQMAFYLDRVLARWRPLRVAARGGLAALSWWGAVVDRALPDPDFALAHLLVARRPAYRTSSIRTGRRRCADR